MSAASTVVRPHQTEVLWYIHIFRVVTPLSIAFKLHGFVASSRLRGVFAASRLLRGFAASSRFRGFFAASRLLRGFAASSRRVSFDG